MYNDVSSSARHNKRRPMLRWRVLPPGEFNGVIPEPLPVSMESFMLIDLTVANKQTWLQRNQFTKLQTNDKPL